MFLWMLLVTFRLIVFRPFASEVLIAKVKSSSSEGIRRTLCIEWLNLAFSFTNSTFIIHLYIVTLGFFDDLIIPPSFLPVPSALFVFPIVCLLTLLSLICSIWQRRGRTTFLLESKRRRVVFSRATWHARVRAQLHRNGWIRSCPRGVGRVSWRWARPSKDGGWSDEDQRWKESTVYGYCESSFLFLLGFVVSYVLHSVR